MRGYVFEMVNGHKTYVKNFPNLVSVQNLAYLHSEQVLVSWIDALGSLQTEKLEIDDEHMLSIETE